MDEKGTAYHEAGHAVAGVLLGFEVKKATIIPDENEGSAGHVIIPSCINDFAFYELEDEQQEELVKREAVVLLSGPVAKKILLGEGYTEDSWSTDLASTMLGHISGGPEEEEVLLNQLVEEAEELLQRKWSAVSRLANELLEHKTLDAQQIVATVRGEYHG